jgi:oligoendopeptidase F
VKNVKDFLSAGSSRSVKDIFMDLGVDISKREFWEESIEKLEF